MTTSPLVIRFGALGDMILMTPLMRALAKRHGQPCDIIGRGGWMTDLYQGLDYVGEKVFLNSRKTPYFLSADQKALIRWLRMRQHPAVYLIEDDDKSHKLLHRAGIKGITSIRDVPKLINEHVVDHHARVGDFRANDEYDTMPELIVSDEEKARLGLWLKSIGCGAEEIVLIQFGNRKTMAGSLKVLESKHWPEARWTEVIRGVLETKPEAEVLVIGSEKEQPAALSLASSVSDDRVKAVADQLPLRRLLALIEGSHSLISVDTGPAHAAGALNCPQVVLFGQTDPRVNRPVSRDARVKVVHGPATSEDIDGKRAWAETHRMDSISVKQVLDEWTSLEQA